MTTTEKVESSLGELLAIKAFCIAVIATHPNPAEFRRAFDAVFERMMSRLLQSPDVSDKTIESLREVGQALAETLSH